METARQNANEAHTRYLESGEDDREYDEEGVLIRSTAHELDYETLNATLAVTVVREAFVTSAFHYWEVSARGWTGLNGQHDNFNPLCKASAKCYAISPQLIVINHLNNTIKHNNAYHARELAKRHKGYFSRLPASAMRKSSGGSDEEVWTWTLQLSDAHVEEALEIVRASGPQY